METSGVYDKDWNSLVAAGDAPSLIAVFREAAGSAPHNDSALKSISDFLQLHLFQSALEVDLPRLFSTDSISYVEAVLGESGSPHGLDAREILTELLSIRHLPNGYSLTVYVKLIRSTLRQLLLDTIKRKKKIFGNVVELLSETQATIRAWYAGVYGSLSHIIEGVSRQDAVPKMIQTVKEFRNDDDNDDDSGEKGNEAYDDSKNGMLQVADPHLLEDLFLLSSDLLVMVGNPSKVVPLLLMLRTSIVATQPYSDDNGEFLHKVGSDVRQWANLFYRVEDKKLELHTNDYNRPKSLEVMISKGYREEMCEKIVRVLLGISPFCELVSYLQRCSGNEFAKDFMDSVAYEDNEHGKDASDPKSLATLHDLKAERDNLCILSDEDDLEEENNNHESNVSMASISLQNIGVMLILFDVLTLERYSPHHLLVSKSPESFFFLTGPMVLESLKSTSLSVVMTGLTFLAILLPHVEAYSIHAHGELNVKSGQLHEFVQKYAGGRTWGFRTKRFELIFELVKSLMNISATCPSESHREIARGVFILFLQRSTFNLRVLIYSVFLALAPFASICSLMLYSLREEWKYNQSDSSKKLGFDFFKTTLPSLLLKAHENWLRKLRIGEMAFVEPMIQSLNFVRCVISEDRKQRPENRLFHFDHTDAKVQLQKMTTHHDTQCDPWSTYLNQLFENVIPPLKAMALTSPNMSTTSMGVVHGVRLSPLDSFALTMCLDGLEEQVVLTN